MIGIWDGTIEKIIDSYVKKINTNGLKFLIFKVVNKKLNDIVLVSMFSTIDDVSAYIKLKKSDSFDYIIKEVR